MELLYGQESIFVFIIDTIGSMSGSLKMRDL